jgi:hypothetical protein
MAANPQILSSLHEYVASKTGKPVGEPKTGGGNPKPPERIPLPDYNDPASRLKYAQLVKDKYKLPSGYGDTFLRMNEIPSPDTDSIPTKQLMLNAAKIANLPPALLHASAMEEGMSGLYPRTIGKEKDQVDWSNNPKYPVNGFVNFGLDTFSDAYPGLVKKGYLPADFNKNFTKAVNKNEKGQAVNSANFTTADAALQAKAAMMRDVQDQVNAYAAKNKIPLTDNSRQFLTLAAYNGGMGAAQNMIQEYNKGGLLPNDAFMKSRPLKSNYNQVWDNVNRRFQLSNALTSEGYFDPPAPVTVNK